MEFASGKFEGPLDLLLTLVRKEEMDIIDIDLHKITRQYLKVINESKHLNLNEGGEFIRMASILIYLKSKSLLPVFVDEEGEEDLVSEVSAEDLKQALIQHSQFLKVAELLNQRSVLDRDIWSCAGYTFVEESSDAIEVGSPMSLFSTCRQMLKQLYIYKTTNLFPSVYQWIHKIRKNFIKGRVFTFKNLLQDKKEPLVHQIVLSFLSLLELGKLGFVSLSQKGDDIQIHSKKTLDEDDFLTLEKHEIQGVGS